MYLRGQVNSFKAGRIKQQYPLWETLTSDPEILNTVKGLTIEFIKTPFQCRVPKPKKFSPGEKLLLTLRLTNYSIKM